MNMRFITKGKLAGTGGTLLLSLLLSFALPAQNGLAPSGAPFIRNYSPVDYGAHNQNWAVAQDARGVIYVGNNNGILEYDGVSWQLIQKKENPIIRSLAIAEDGRVYIGSFSDIGYLAPDTDQKLQYVSLLPFLDEIYRNFADVWQTLVVGQNVYFVSQKYIFQWSGEQMRVWEAQSAFHIGFAVNDQFFVRQKNVGLMHVVSDSLRMAPLGEQFAQERIFAMLPFSPGGKNSFLLAGHTKGLMLYDGLTIEPFASEAAALLADAQVYCGAALAGDQYAFGTLQKGVVIIDAKGRLRHRLDKSTGLQDETIWFLYPDRQGGLWMGMHIGVSRAEISSPHTFFGEREGVEGSVLEIVRHNGQLYVATSMGVYFLDESPGAARAPGIFKRVSGVSPQCWALLPFESKLLAATFEGVYEIREGQGKLIINAYAMSLHRSKQDSNRVFVGMQDGFKSFYNDGGQWIDEGRIQGVDQEIRSIYETEDGGNIWLTALYSGLIRVDFSDGYTPKALLSRFDTLQGLPDNFRSVAFSSSKGTRFATGRGVFSFDEKRQRFSSDTSLIKGLPTEKAELFTVNEDRKGNLWMVMSKKAHSGLARRQPDASYQWDESPFLRISGIDEYFAYPDPLLDEIVWVGCVDRVIRYDGAKRRVGAPPFPTLIRQVVANGDSLLYGGAGLGQGNPLKLRYAFNSLRFRYAAPYFDDESKTTFQYQLEGYDKEWSNWSAETYKDYTGLPSGVYRFLVRSKNIYQQTGETAVWEFRILPPFYLSWWAYLLYAILFAGLIFAFRANEVKRIRKKHLLEMKQLEYEKLKELDQLKSRFFANISHEFRTPLTLILGPIDTLLSSQPEEAQVRHFLMIRRNAQRLLRLINQLLDLSRLEAGKMKLELAYEDLIPFLRGLAHSFESLVENKKISLRFECALEKAFLYFDRDKMEQIFANLISNAIKFTPEGGTVRIGVINNAQSGWMQIEVSDNGSGISAAELPFVFDRFYQGDEAARIAEPGSGIGLALTKELVELHQGRISVSSAEGLGARFCVLLPYGNEPSDAPAVETADPVPENTLLLVEDNPDMRAFIRESLAGKYRIVEAVDGQDGVEKAFEHIPDIIISDVMMPRKDGMELCDILKNDERSSHIPIVLLTAKANVESRIAGLDRGADDYMAKPFHREELLVRVRNLLAGRQRLRDRYASLQPPAPAEDKNLQIEDAFLHKIREIALQHIFNQEFEIDQLAQKAGMSRSQLFRKIKALTGHSPSLFIRTIRLQRGKELLETTQLNVNEIAYEVGFSAPSYFSDAFAEAYGVRPSQVRK